MSITELKIAASRKSKVTPRAIGYRASKIDKIYGPFSDEIAYGIVAQQSGVEVSKIISDTKILEQIRDQIDRIAELESTLQKPKTKTIVITKIVQIAKEIQLSDPILDSKVIDDAKEMTIQYAQLYIFENSVREVVNRVLSKRIGSNWWSRANVNKEIFDTVQGRIKNEEQNPWHGRRGAHPIYYTDLSHLIKLFRRYWSYFSDIFPRQEWISEKLEQISFSRNIVDHHNPLSKQDRNRLTMNLKDWQNQIVANKNKL